MKSRKPRDTSKKRDSILDAAIKTYQEYGYYSSSMDMVANMAKASKRTLYNHFKSKEILFQEVISRFLKGQEDLSLIEYSNITPIKEQLHKIAETEIYLIRTRSNRGLSKVLTTVFLQDPELGARTRSKYTRSRLNLLNWFKEAMESKALPIKDPQKELMLFISMVQGYITWPALFTPFTNQELDFRKNEIIEKYLKGL